MQQLALLDPVVDQPEPQGVAKGGAVPLLARYLNDIGQTTLLSREEEAELSGVFQRAREELVQIFSELPAGLCDFVLGEVDRETEAGEWTFADLEHCFSRLVKAAPSHADVGVRRSLRTATRVKRRLDSARETMVQANLKLVTHVAKEYSRNGSPDLDLIQEGNLGLMRAVEKFDHDRGFRFSTYAYWWIRQAIGRAISDKSRTIRIPVHLGRKMRKVQKAFLKLADELGRDPTKAEIAAETELPRGSVDEILRVAHGQ